MREYENKLLLQGFLNIAGVDEAGRGPVAGPVVAAAVILDPDYNNEQVKDSKQLTEKQRRVVYWDIINNAIAYGVGIVSVSEIDETNILEATKQAMKIAISNLKLTPDYILIDAVELDIDTYHESIIKGDQKSISIAAASIVAKETRDEIMRDYDKMYPNYGFKQHKGYLTKMHQENLDKYGVSPIHRKTFAPIKDMINDEK